MTRAGAGSKTPFAPRGVRAFGLKVPFEDERLGYAELETGGVPLAIASHSLSEMLMPDGYERARIAAVEIEFLTRDVPSAFAKAIREGAVPIPAPSECLGP
jgi:lactoylglutathione lyase